VRPTALTAGCTTVAVVLGVLGMYLDSLAAAAGAVGLTALLGGQASLFLYRTTRFADYLQVEREVGKQSVSLGASVEVRVRVMIRAAPGLQVRLNDLPPQSAVYDPAEALIRSGEGRYQVRFMTPGDVSFRGLLLETADRFFSMTSVCTLSCCVGETVTVLPAESRIPGPATGDSTWVKELDRLGMPRGEGVRGFRPFRRGDDASMMDWKLTAKYGRPFVREPTVEVGTAPLVIVDLPVSADPGAVAILSTAGEAIERVIREHGQCSLLVIAGGEVIDFRYHESDLVALLRLLSLQLPDPVHPLYRVLDPLVLLGKLRTIERELSIPSRRLAAALRATVRGEVRSAFEEEVGHAMAMAEHREVVVYTAPSGEMSHLNLISAAARRQRRHLVIMLPRSEKGSTFWLSPYPRVEAI
jgi:uncharacterized protein (DUF58 family)